MHNFTVPGRWGYDDWRSMQIEAISKIYDPSSGETTRTRLSPQALEKLQKEFARKFSSDMTPLFLRRLRVRRPQSQ